jgi:hypothetical protein
MSEHRLLDLWLPPEGSGEPVACLATSFTFDTDFFRDDCLSRFLGLRSSLGEEAGGLLAQINELEERLADVQVSVITDRSTRIEGRNLRWDVLSVEQPGGLMHAKTTVLLWENTTRIIIGSANLTAAGYRYQRELAVAFDLETDRSLSGTFWRDYLTAAVDIVALAPDDLISPGPKQRALDVLRLLEARIDGIQFVRTPQGGSVHVVRSQPGKSAVKQIEQLIRGPRPRRLVAMSPFWDQEDKGSADAVRALTRLVALTGPAAVDLLVPLETGSAGTIAQAPSDLAQRTSRKGVEAGLRGISGETTDGVMEWRRLHAKALLLESESSIILMIGSSNMTSAGLGLNPRAGHFELNVGYVLPRSNKMDRKVQELLPTSTQLDDSITFAVMSDVEDEPTSPPLPSGFVSALLDYQESKWSVVMNFDSEKLPSVWAVRVGTTQTPITTSLDGPPQGVIRIPLHSEALPQSLLVEWQDSEGQSWVADWVLNVANPGDLPLDDRFRLIPIDLIVQVLAQRSINSAAALERLLERLSTDGATSDDFDASPLDPLKAFDDSRALLRRIGLYGRALDELANRLNRPAPTVSSLGWRLNGLVSPSRLAEGWVDQALTHEIPLEVAHFLLAELRLVIRRINWDLVCEGLDAGQVQDVLDSMRLRLDEAASRLPELPGDHPISAYASEVQGVR